MRLARSPHVLVSAALLLTVLLGAACAQGPDPATWVRTRGTVLDPINRLGRPVAAMEGEVVLVWQPWVSEAQKAAIRRSVSGSKYDTVQGTQVEVLIVGRGRETDVLRALTGQPELRMAHCNQLAVMDQAPARFEPNDTLWGQQRPLHDLTRSPEAWALFPGDTPSSKVPVPGDESIIVAILDTGTQWNHADLIDNVWTNPGEIAGNGKDDDGNGYVDDVHGYSFVRNDGDPNPTLDPKADWHPHGTHVAGIAAAVGNNNRGVTGQIMKCQIMAVQVGNLVSFLDTVTMVKAIAYAIDNGADVISMSWHYPGSPPYPEFTDEFVRGFSAGPVPGKNDHRHGVVIVAACGNDDSNLAPETPVGCETDANEIIGVSAVNSKGVKTPYSNYSTSPHLVDIATPGGDSSENLPYESTWIYDPTDPTNWPEYGTMEGTSMACPHAAGICALIRAGDPLLTSVEVRDALLDYSNGDLLYTQNPGFAAQKSLGRGIADAYASVQSVMKSGPETLFVTPTPGARLTTATPKIVITVRKRGGRAPDITRITIRLDPAAGSTPSDADAVWLDMVNNTTLVAGSDGKDDRSGGSFPTDGRFEFKLPGPLSIGSAGSSAHTIEVVVRDARTPVEDFLTTGSFRITAVEVGPGRRMFSVPYSLIQGMDISKALPRTVFAQPFGGTGEAQIARWDPTSGHPTDIGQYIRSDVDGVDHPYIETLEPGKGYWVDLPAGTQRLIIEGDQIDTSAFQLRDAARDDTTADAEFLEPGWHQLANPFPFPISLSTFLVTDDKGTLLPLAMGAQQGICRGAIFRYADGAYIPEVIPNATLDPFEGYWFRTLKKCKVFAVPTASASSATAKGAPEPNLLWTADLSAAAGDEKAMVTIGSSAVATEGYDAALDMESPPPLNTKVRLGITNPRVGSEVLLRDVRGVVDHEASWTVVARSAANTHVVMSWGDLRSVPRDYAVSLRDEATGRTVSLRHESSYAFDSGTTAAERRFTVTVRRVDPSTAFRITVDGSALARGVSTVSFRLTEDAEVDVVVLNAAGRVVRHVIQGERMAAGSRSAAWDGRSDTGTLMPGGQYRIEVSARNDSAEVARGTASISR